MRNLSKKTRRIFFLLIFIIFWWRGVIFLDPDFGWHLKLGQIILDSGIPRTDPFSYTMPSYPFIDHEWLTNAVIAKLYPILGKFGLAGIYTALVFLALIISLSNPISRKTSNRKPKPFYLKTVPLILAAGILLDYSGVRPQVESWLLLAILLTVILNRSIWFKWRWCLPIFFTVWANLHGSFAVGVAVLFIVVVLKSWREKKLWLEGIIVSILCLLATLINPYGIRLWWEVWQQISDTSLRWTIIEWHPTIFVFNPSLSALVSLSIILILRYRKKFKTEELGLYFAFLILGISSLRHVPLWTIVCLPMLTTALGMLDKEASKIKQGILKLKRAYNFAIVGSLLILIIQMSFSLINAKLMSEERFYPKKAVEFLKANLPQGQIFSQYGWGGYLIWKLPEKKVFIDGRMPSWRWQSAPSSESNYAMKDHQSITREETKYLPVFEKYGVTTVLWPAPKQKKFTVLTRFSQKESGFNFPKQLEKNNWLILYQDTIAIILTKDKPLN